MNNFDLKRQKRESIIRDASPWHSIWFVCLPMIILVTIQAGYNVLDKVLAINFASEDVWKAFPDAVHQQMIAENITDPLKAAGSLINLATQYSGNVFNLVWAFATLAAMGSAISFSMKFGARDRDGMEKSVGNGVYLSLFSSLILLFVTLMLILPQFNYPLLDLQANIGNRSPIIVKALNSLGFQYSLLISVSAPISYLSFLFLSLLRSEGRISYLIIVSLISLIINGLFAYIFVGIAHLMLWGAMMATILAWLFSLLACLALVLFSKNSYITFTKNGFKFDRFISQNIVALGISGLVVNLSAVLVSMFETNLTGALPSGGGFSNDNAILQTVYSAISPWIFLTLAPAFGIWQGSATLISYAYGAKMYKRCWDIMKRVTLLLFIWFLFDYIMFISIGKYMLALFDDVVDGHNLLLFLNFMTYPFATIGIASLIFNQSINKGKVTFFLTLIRALLVPVPVVFIAFGIAKLTSNPVAFFATYGCCDLISGVSIAIIDYYVLRNYRHKMINITESNWNTTFETLKEIDYKVKIVKLKHKKKVNTAKIAELERLLQREYLLKEKFIRKISNI